MRSCFRQTNFSYSWDRCRPSALRYTPPHALTHPTHTHFPFSSRVVPSYLDSPPPSSISLTGACQGTCWMYLTAFTIVFSTSTLIVHIGWYWKYHYCKYLFVWLSSTLCDGVVPDSYSIAHITQRNRIHHNMLSIKQNGRHLFHISQTSICGVIHF